MHLKSKIWLKNGFVSVKLVQTQILQQNGNDSCVKC